MDSVIAFDEIYGSCRFFYSYLDLAGRGARGSNLKPFDYDLVILGHDVLDDSARFCPLPPLPTLLAYNFEHNFL